MRPARTRFHCVHPFIGALLFLAAMQAKAQDAAPADRLLNSDPQQLLEVTQENRVPNTLTNLVDLDNRDIREAPANVQVITARQIQASGARNLMDALELVPGLSFARDADDVIGVAIHGIWAEEGRCLFLLDGRQLNENDFGTYGIGMRIPLANVERIEVVMGPGTLIHGGYAELGVVNIVTRTAELGAGSMATMQTGLSDGSVTKTQMCISGSQRLGREQEMSYLASYGRGQRSNALRQLPDGTWLNYADSTATQANTFQFNYRWRNLQATMLYMDQTSAVSNAAYGIQQRDIILGLTYQRRILRNFDVLARLNHADQLPWYYVNTSDQRLLATNANNLRTSCRAFIGYKPNKTFSLHIGAQFHHQESTFYLRSGQAVFNINGNRSLAMDGGAVFALASFNTKAGLLGAGYRLEQNSLAGAFRAARLSYTKVLGPINLKALWNTGFKVPPVMNINYALPGSTVLAETADTKELELGAKLFRGLHVTVNAFRTQVANPAVYIYDALAGDRYGSRPRTATEGLDVRITYESKKTTVLAGYGQNRPMEDIDVPELALPPGHEALQGIPAARGYVAASFEVLPSLTLRAKATWKDRAWSFQYTGGDTLSLMEWPAETVISAGITIRPKRSARFTIDLDCLNMADTRRYILGPTANGIIPFALNGREYTMALTYKFVK